MILLRLLGFGYFIKVLRFGELIAVPTGIVSSIVMLFVVMVAVVKLRLVIKVIKLRFGKTKFFLPSSFYLSFFTNVFFFFVLVKLSN